MTTEQLESSIVEKYRAFRAANPRYPAFDERGNNASLLDPFCCSFHGIPFTPRLNPPDTAPVPYIAITAEEEDFINAVENSGECSHELGEAIECIKSVDRTERDWNEINTILESYGFPQK